MASRWNYLPPKGMKPVELHRVTVRRGGRDWNGSWEIEGDRLVVSSAYGSRSEPAGRAETRAERAATLMAEILDTHGPG